MNESFQQAGKEGYLYVTINTYKDKFPAIYSYLTNYGFKEYKKEPNNWNGQKIVKSFFRKNIE
ncbi:hypothetical protein A2715_03145 [Candidatus Woesebacteria bacterium RIFCSPHIGHO2_01_FULL_39_32]|uniref:Uncharacterized protein n=2 Tax=Candidatus Woeseibacteriota TaxID=1752722 RepID=A0A0G0PYX5_9BACT|nr:MAG: hypothetical protein UT61_C0009G0019 [Candidatus Woesebacteria bacterium GW2011_GWA1_39_8]OGM04918.1 MAG: hypothetical protein A2124_05600 [Candidatus Woesebacteria bacterium GWB1_37_5]OGM24737.1 MAG: hypothetical protein A2715_03145 [Candidatus Woesebacteria bacterium RIFCSPHIGHO2_01_FULL_39_32]OGM38192.1 MAG: hypothetical protein A3F01_00915 [Candidatus Woesebacteria bacterium RIFCSPHIGHO2_12_FULL_38_11]OGM64563.1 MAG: hypothetical protein A2893_06060 [Candidatus Woesebacteria bacteri